MLRCCTPAMGCSKAPAMSQNRMRCSAMQFGFLGELQPVVKDMRPKKESDTTVSLLAE